MENPVADSNPSPKRRISARLNCPHCHNPIEVVTDSVDEDVLCPSCGSAVRVDSGPMLTWDKKRLPTLDQFQLIEAVGRGAFGTVYKAFDQQLQRTVAVKIPRSGVLETEEDEDRFVREARNVAQLRHPGIVAIHSVGRSDAFPYLVSEFVEGVTLSDRLKSNRISLKESARLIREICIALQHAHSQGVVHRDLKPSNIMLTPDGQPRIMDFGVAKRNAGEITMTIEGQILGTPAYMSPEQAGGLSHHANEQSDIYSMGVILFQLLTGETPFRGDVQMLIYQVQHEEPPSPRNLNHQVPRDLETICLKCIAKEPLRRYASARDLAGDLQRYLDAKPILARPVSRIEHAWRWCRRNPVVAGLSTAATLLLTLTALVSYAAYHETSRLAIQEKNAKNEAIKSKEKAEVLAANEETLKRNALKAAEMEHDANKRERAAREQAEQSADLARRQEALTRRHLYGVHLKQAEIAWYNNQIEETVRLLEFYRPPFAVEAIHADLRGFEWYFLDRFSHNELVTLNGHLGVVKAVAYSPDGQRLASAGEDKTIKIWNTTNWAELLTLSGHTGSVTSVVFSPDGQSLASCGTDTMKLWNATTGREVSMLSGNASMYYNVAYSPDGQRLASSSYDRSITLWDVVTGQALPITFKNNDLATIVAYNPDGRSLAAGHRGAINIWDATTGVKMNTIALDGALWIDQLAYRPDGRRLASTGIQNGITIWDLPSGTLVRTLARDNVTPHLTFSPDGKQLASSGRAIIVWDADTGRTLFERKGHKGSSFGIMYSPDGHRLASAGADMTVKIWDTAFHPTRDTGWTTLTGHSEGVARIAMSSDGIYLASASEDKTIKIWDVATTAELQTLTGHSEPVNDVVFSPDGQRLASCSHDATIKIWNPTTGEQLQSFHGDNSAVLSVAYSPDGNQLASGSLNGLITVFDAMTGVTLNTIDGHSRWTDNVAYSPDGRKIASSGEDGKIIVWNAATGAKLLSIDAGHVYELAFCPDGRQFASSSVDRTIKIWDATTGTNVLTLVGHLGPVSCVTYSPDGARLVTTDGRSLIIWDAETGTALLTLNHLSHFVRMHPDGKQIATCTSTKPTVTLLDIRQSSESQLRMNEQSSRELVSRCREQATFGSTLEETIRSDRSTTQKIRDRALAIVARKTTTVQRGR